MAVEIDECVGIVAWARTIRSGLKNISCHEKNFSRTGIGLGSDSWFRLRGILMSRQIEVDSGDACLAEKGKSKSRWTSLLPMTDRRSLRNKASKPME